MVDADLNCRRENRHGARLMFDAGGERKQRRGYTVPSSRGERRISTSTFDETTTRQSQLWGAGGVAGHTTNLVKSGFADRIPSLGDRGTRGDTAVVDLRHPFSKLLGWERTFVAVVIAAEGFCGGQG
jgi:hypothetical protein